MTEEQVIEFVLLHSPTANAVISALASKGYVIMPMNPTQEMIDAWRMDQSQARSLESSYRAMINAALGAPPHRRES